MCIIILLIVLQDPGQNQIPAFMLPPLYHCGYQSIVIIFATIMQQDQPVSSINPDGSQNSIRQITLLNNIISEFDQVIFRNICKLLKFSN